MDQIAAALVLAFSVTPAQADDIVAANRKTLNSRSIPHDVEAWGHIGADMSSHVMLVRGSQVICDLAIPHTHWL